METESKPVIHIRKTARGGKDRRTKAYRYSNKESPTRCGAAPSRDDDGSHAARHSITHFECLVGMKNCPEFVRDYFARVCPDCLEDVRKGMKP